jgi:hypothetical protein
MVIVRFTRKISKNGGLVCVTVPHALNNEIERGAEYRVTLKKIKECEGGPTAKKDLLSPKTTSKQFRGGLKID